MTDRFGRPQLELSSENFARIRELMLQKTGMYFDDSKFSMMRSIISDRIQITNTSNFENYFQTLTRGTATTQFKNPSQNEFRRLVEELAVNETSFFRNKEHFKAIYQEVFPRLYRRKASTRHLRFWSAGCSSGQEAYSLAMLMIEFLEQQGEKVSTRLNDPLAWQIEIVATDISEKILQAGRLGRFRQEDLRGLEETRLARFFRPVGADTDPLDAAQAQTPKSARSEQTTPHHTRQIYELRPEVHSLVRFSYFNMADKLYPLDKIDGFDLILCENVMIYFAPDITRQVIENLYKALYDGGFLFIGFSETLWQISERFKLINNHNTFYYQKPFPGDPTPQVHLPDVPTTGPLNPLLVKSFSQKVSAEPLQPEATARRKPPELPAWEYQSNSTSPAEYRKPNSIAEKSLSMPIPKPVREPKAASGPDWRTALADGLNLIENNEFEKAALVLSQALADGPHEVDVLCALAQLKVKLGEYELASDYSRQAIALNPLCEPAHLLLAMLHYQENRIEEAIKEFQQTTYINMNSVVAHMRLGDIHDKRGQRTTALLEYRNALKALEKRRPDEYIEGFPVEILKRTCLDNIRRLQGTRRIL